MEVKNPFLGPIVLFHPLWTNPAQHASGGSMCQHASMPGCQFCKGGHLHQCPLSRLPSCCCCCPLSPLHTLHTAHQTAQSALTGRNAALCTSALQCVSELVSWPQESTLATLQENPHCPGSAYCLTALLQSFTAGCSVLMYSSAVFPLHFHYLPPASYIMISASTEIPFSAKCAKVNRRQQ